MPVAPFLATLALVAVAAPDPVVTEREPRDVEGWTVRVDARLLSGPDSELGKTALRVLGAKLAEVRVLLPKDRLAKLQKVVVTLDARHPLKTMQYHPSAGWLKEHGYEPVLARSVHIPRADALAGRMLINEQPMAVLHELAHAYHDQVLGFDEPKIKAAWTRVKESGQFDQVLHIGGSKRKHYALTNQMEFFAEMTESYFGTNDFYPFVRGELKRDFPEVYQLMQDVWGTKP